MKLNMKALFVAAAFVPTWVALPGSAQAANFPNPFAEGAYAYVANFIDGQWVAWFPKSAFDCDHIYWQYISPSSGFTEFVQVSGGAYDDNMVEWRWYGGTICGWDATPPVHNGYSITFGGSSGNDRAEGFANTLAFGHTGNDALYTYRPSGSFGVTLWGNEGNDSFCSCSTNTQEAYYGYTGTDCVYDANGSYSVASSIESFGTCGCGC